MRRSQHCDDPWLIGEGIFLLVSASVVFCNEFSFTSDDLHSSNVETQASTAYQSNEVEHCEHFH